MPPAEAGLLACLQEGRTIATIDELLDKVDSKYTLVHLSARRAREINAYYHSLGEGLGQYTPPLVESSSNKPLSIALEEIAAEKIVVQRPEEAARVAEELLGSEAGEGGEAGADEDAEVVLLETGADRPAEEEPEAAAVQAADEGSDPAEAAADESVEDAGVAVEQDVANVDADAADDEA